jgi:glutamine cyclotransferase
MFRRLILGICLLLVAIFSAARANAQHVGHSDGYQIVHVYPHDPGAFTQGLVYVDAQGAVFIPSRQQICTVNLSRPAVFVAVSGSESRNPHKMR